MVAGASYGIIGALAAFPRRLARREVDRQGGVLRRGLTRRITHAVFGRRLLERLSDAAIAAHFDAAIAAGATPLSENGFRRALGLLPRAAGGSLSRQALLEQSGLAPTAIEVLILVLKSPFGTKNNLTRVPGCSWLYLFTRPSINCTLAWSPGA